jgi:predicted bacteriocin transport accessory protein
MKKFKYILAIFVIAILFTGCSSKGSLTSISYSSLKDKLNNKETFFFVVVRQGCQYCEKFLPTVEDVVKEYDLKGYSLDLSTFSQDELDEFDKDYNVSGTPTTIFIIDGEEGSVLQRLVGNQSAEKLIQKLKANNFIK